jgi:hypothetical protein
VGGPQTFMTLPDTTPRALVYLDCYTHGVGQFRQIYILAPKLKTVLSSTPDSDDQETGHLGGKNLLPLISVVRENSWNVKPSF